MSYRVQEPTKLQGECTACALHVYDRFHYFLNNHEYQGAPEICNIRIVIVKTGKVYRKRQESKGAGSEDCRVATEGGKSHRPCTVSDATDKCRWEAVIHLSAAPRQLGASRTSCCVPGAPLPQVEIQQHIISLETIKFGQELGHLFPTTGSPKLVGGPRISIKTEAVIRARRLASPPARRGAEALLAACCLAKDADRSPASYY
ncbi:hypothetical protein E2C01_099558 [Portunus trituberculatus]|uniref:Uncharacterized protein n=1 Tax=Portunus trituberculatus TaxID=210409 RepID=A0A5B7K9Z1_PORTR|nr:hypothetical protein [Portunus trituberculatus]